jgi:hypothetical protein
MVVHTLQDRQVPETPSGMLGLKALLGIVQAGTEKTLRGQAPAASADGIG